MASKSWMVSEFAAFHHGLNLYVLNYIFLFDHMQRGIDALPGMTILSACLETVSIHH